MPTIRMKQPFNRLLLLAAAGALLLTVWPASRTVSAAPGGATFDYYVLSLSWAPDFCAAPGYKDPRECAPGRRLGFIVHGLWPQAETGRAPENCGGSPVSAALVASMLNYIPSESLIQHEWATHGTCTGLSAVDYFSLVREARNRLSVPADLLRGSPNATGRSASGQTGFGEDRTMTPDQLASEFAAANRAFPAAAFRVTCTRGELQEVRVCFNKDLSPRACSVSVGAACSAPGILVRAPR